jgi:hypothetical protein
MLGMPATIILFGAFDRHNFGDLLFPHIATALLPGRDLVVAGLADRDLRPFGGHLVQALHPLAGDARIRGAHLVHVGGEILTCSARQAAVMLLPNEEVGATLSYIEHQPDEERRWLRAMLGTASPMPYIVSREQMRDIDRIVFDAVGGVALGALSQPWHQVVLARLAAADTVGVRDSVTLGHLQSGGIASAELMPDPAVMVDVLFGDSIRARAAQAPVGDALQAFPGGYIAVQLAADFGDNATLDLVAAQLDAAVADTGLGVVLFRAGAAPWHDDLGMLARVAARMASSAVRLFRSLDVWDTCALLAHSSVHAGSSLHGHIVAAAFGVPAVGLLRRCETGQFAKLAAYAATWESPGNALVRPVDRLAEGIRGALRGDAMSRHEQRGRWVSAYREGFELLTRCLS